MNARPSFDDMAAEFDIGSPLPDLGPSGQDHPLEGLADHPDDVPAGMGDNNPPEPTPYEATKAAVADLANEAQHWLDGTGVNSQVEADAVGKLILLLRAARTAADNARKVENEPFDAGKAEVQARYNPVLKRADLATDAAKKALTPWLMKVRRENDEAARAAREEADRKAALAAEAFRQASATNLAEREAAEALFTEAKKASVAANKAEATTAKAGAGTGQRAVGLRTYKTPVMIDDGVALHHYLALRLPDINELLTGFAREDVAAGRTEIPGFRIDTEQRAA